jgi:hypothetical protein
VHHGNHYGENGSLDLKQKIQIQIQTHVEKCWKWKQKLSEDIESDSAMECGTTFMFWWMCGLYETILLIPQWRDCACVFVYMFKFMISVYKMKYMYQYMFNTFCNLFVKLNNGNLRGCAKTENIKGRECY